MSFEPLYFPGVNEALERLDGKDESALLEVLDTLYGRENLRFGATHAEILAEARRQVRKDFENPAAAADRAYIEALVSANRRGAL